MSKDVALSQAQSIIVPPVEKAPHLPAPFSSVSLLLQPAIAAFLAWLILQEPLGSSQALGGIIVLSGIVLARLGSR